MSPIDVLVVEDEVLQRHVLKAALTDQGYRVDTACDGLDAIWKIGRGRFAVVIIDYQLPDMHGLAVASVIRSLVGQVACPILIAFTAAARELADKTALLCSGFDEIVSKQCDIATLLAAVASQLERIPQGAEQRDEDAGCLMQNWFDYFTDGKFPDAERQAMPPRLLVVEDDFLQQTILRSTLETHGYLVEVATDGLAAVHMIRARGYDLVLVDYQIPEMDGLALARLIVDLMSEDVRPRLVALTSAKEALISQQAVTGSPFDVMVEKSTDLPGLLVTVQQQLRSAPNIATRRAAELIWSPALLSQQHAGAQLFGNDQASLH